MTRMSILWCLLLICCYPSMAQEFPPLGGELVTNGGFEQADREHGTFRGWSGAARVGQQGGNHWAILESDTPQRSVSLGQEIKLAADWWKIKLACRVRVTNVVQGKEGWHDARIAMSFHNEKGDRIGGWPSVLHWTGTTDGWVEQSKEFIIPRGANALRFSCSLFSTTGKAEFDDVSFVVTKTYPRLEDGKLPNGVKLRWDLESAFREETPTRGRVCINGLWKFHPAKLKDTQRPATGTGWGYFKVPASWPGPGGRCRHEALGPDIWEAEELDLAKTDVAWYEREVTIPSQWTGRKVFLDCDNVQNAATVFVNGTRVGRLAWPGGRIEITPAVQPGQQATLTLRVTALPDDEEKIVVMGPDVIEKARQEVRQRGLCGDCFLVSEPAGARISDVFVQPSVRQRALGLQVELADLPVAQRFRLRAKVREAGKVVKEFSSPVFASSQLRNGCLNFSGRWADPKLWDIDQPKLYRVQVALESADGKLLDQSTPTTFGFREFWIKGRNLMLNGRVVHLRCLDYFNHARDFALASYPVAKEAFRRARELGFNYVIHSNYDYDTQDVCYLDDTLRAGDEVGFPMSYTIRHVKRIYRQFDDPQKRAHWEQVVRYLVRRVRNHPCILMYAMDHNFLGYAGDQNPSRLDGVYMPQPEDNTGLAARRKAAALAQQIVQQLDPTRPVYHHESGHFGDFITLNCYLNFTQLQERIEWLSHWAKQGRKPIFFVELGLPHSASFGRHRGAPFIWRNPVSSEPLTVEFGAMYKGDEAYKLNEGDLSHYDNMARVYARGEPFYFWEVLGMYWAEARENNWCDMKSLFTRQTWPAWRTWGVPAVLPWDQGEVARCVKPPAERRKPLPTDWDHLQRPGLSPDYMDWSSNWLSAFDYEGRFELSSVGQAFRKYNQDLLAYIAGPERRFTARDHNFAPGERVEKQIVCINDLSQSVTATYTWTARLDGRRLDGGQGKLKVPAGGQVRAAFQFIVPESAKDGQGRITLKVSVDGKSDESLRDEFRFNVLTPSQAKSTATIAVYDPRGKTAPILRRAGLKFETMAELSVPDGGLLILGRESLGPEGPRADLGSFLDRGGAMLVFEQQENVLSRRFGFRTASPCTRRVFVRQPHHPACVGLSDEVLCDWRGSSTLVEPYPETVGYEKTYPLTDWCGFHNTRSWKWGNYGAVATTLIEKPQRGDFQAILDCEFDLQYTPLLEYRRGRGRIIFCQLDLSGRTAPDPAADRLLANLLTYAQTPPPASRRTLYVGGENGRKTLDALAVQYTAPAKLDSLSPGDLLIVGEGADLRGQRDRLAAAVRTGAIVFSLPRTAQDLVGWLPFTVKTQPQEVVFTLVGKPEQPLLAGLGNSEFHWRGRTPIQALTALPDGAFMVDTGVVGAVPYGKGQYVFCQVTPQMFEWQQKPYLKLSWQRAATLLSRLLHNCGAQSNVPLVQFFADPPDVELSLAGEWKALRDPEKKGDQAGYAQLDFDDAAWQTLSVPGSWEEQWPNAKEYNGVVWYRKHFRAPAELGRAELHAVLGAVDDEDWTFLNGKLIGHVGQDTNPDDYWSARREYGIPRELLRPGADNVLVVKVNDLRQAGGIMREPVGIFSPPRWVRSYYLNAPVATDDPYRYCRW